MLNTAQILWADLKYKSSPPVFITYAADAKSPLPHVNQKR